MEDWPPRKGDFSIGLFVVELFALVGTAPSMSPLLKYHLLSCGQQDQALKDITVRNARNTVPMSRRPVPLHKSCPLPIQTLFQGKTVHRCTRSQDCVTTYTVFFFHPYLYAQRMTSLHPVASVLAARKMSHAYFRPNTNFGADLQTSCFEFAATFCLIATRKIRTNI